MEIKIVDKTDVQKIEERNEQALPQQVVDGGNEGEINQIAIKHVLEIEHGNVGYDNEIDTLVRWAKTKVDDPGDYTALKWAVRDLRMRLGTPAFGDSIKHLARFAYLDLEEQRIKAEKRKFN